MKKSLRRLLSGVETAGEIPAEDIEIGGLAYDSRRVEPGDLFFAIEGFQRDGHEFLPRARVAGAAAALVTRKVELAGLPLVEVTDARRAMAAVAAEFYDHPSRKLTLAGVTGTNGKTTTTFMLESIMAAAGARTGLIGGIEYRTGARPRKARRTTPEAPDLQAMLAEAVAHGLDFVTAEISSHGLALHRADMLDLDVAVFTNLSRDHLDLHGDLDDYYQVKRRLFTGDGRGLQPPSAAAVNVGDEHGRRLAAELSGTGVELVTFATGGHDATVTVQAADATGPGLRIVLELPGWQGELQLGVNGGFNAENAAAAAAAAVALGAAPGAIVTGLERFRGAPGRFELLDVDQPFKVIIDYAHNEDGLRRAIAAARQLARGRLILVFGCPGMRDRGKRPLMGRIAGEAADLSVLTTDDCYQESPSVIMDEVEAGLAATGGEYRRLEDRRRAIAAALDAAGAGDVVLVAGKGHEELQLMPDGERRFNDREVVEELLRQRR